MTEVQSFWRVDNLKFITEKHFPVLYNLHTFTNRRIKMKKILLSSSFVLLLSACAATPPKNVEIPVAFDANFAKAQLNGKEKVIGSAFLRQNGGSVVTCAGSTVDLYPATKYTEARMFHTYQINQWNGVRYKANNIYTPDPIEFETYKKSTTCDAQGNFEFSGLKEGDYFVVTKVEWSVPGPYGMEYQGGYVNKKVSVKKGTDNKVILSQ